ncbi:MFS transporter [uncultured Ferrimonas sp.]|uniref:MFS transporter n=1 Tax=uncultured Ferrimonas sp. TaxID=432640 RepID=UPI0026266FD8|nr:MFS transporter [uncultured Ferrimonas sp.]
MFRSLLCASALVLLYPTAIDLYLVGLPNIATALGASEAQLHMAFSVYLAGMAASMAVAGRVSDQLGRKPVAIVAAVIFMAASLYAAQALHSSAFLWARLGQGIGAGGCYVVAFAILRDTLAEPQRAKVLTMLNGITCIMPVLAPVLGHLIMLQQPWTALFYTMAALGAAVVVLALLVLNESRPGPLTATNTPSAPEQRSESFLQAPFIRFLIITSFGVTAILTYVNVSPLLLMQQLGFSRSDYASVMAATALISMMVSFSAPWLLGRVGERPLLLLSQVSFIGAALLLLIGSSNSTLLVALALICAGFACGFGVAMSQALAPYQARAGVASSLLGIAQICSSALYIWLLGWLQVSASTMLLVILAGGGVISLGFLLWPLSPAPVTATANNEKISGTAGS